MTKSRGSMTRMEHDDGGWLHARINVMCNPLICDGGAWLCEWCDVGVVQSVTRESDDGQTPPLSAQ